MIFSVNLHYHLASAVSTFHFFWAWLLIQLSYSTPQVLYGDMRELNAAWSGEPWKDAFFTSRLHFWRRLLETYHSSRSGELFCHFPSKLRYHGQKHLGLVAARKSKCGYFNIIFFWTPSSLQCSYLLMLLFWFEIFILEFVQLCYLFIIILCQHFVFPASFLAILLEIYWLESIRLELIVSLC